MKDSKKVGADRLRSTTAFVVVALAFMVNMMGTTLPTTIYRYYQLQYNLTSTTITELYAFGAVGVLGALVVAGNWSDQLGRRPMLLVGLYIAAASAVAFLFSHSLFGLMLGRLLSGISTGIFTGTATAALVELAPPAWLRQAAFVATASNMLGMGLGSILSGVLVEVLPWPTRLPYAVHLLLVCAAIPAVWRLPKMARPFVRMKLRPQPISLPREVRGAFVPAAIAAGAGFVVVGFFAAVAPRLIWSVLGYRSGITVGAIIFLLFLSSAFGQWVQTKIPAPRRQPAGCGGLIAGLSCIALCVPERSLYVLLIATVFTGMGQGISFRAGLGDITAKSPSDRRAEVTSSFFVALYVAISVPVIGIGFVVQRAGIQRATILFAGLTIAPVLVALYLILRGGSRRNGLDDGGRPRHPGSADAEPRH